MKKIITFVMMGLCFLVYIHVTNAQPNPCSPNPCEYTLSVDVQTTPAPCDSVNGMGTITFTISGNPAGQLFNYHWIGPVIDSSGWTTNTTWTATVPVGNYVVWVVS